MSFLNYYHSNLSLDLPIKEQCHFPVETNLLICKATQRTGFYMGLVFIVLITGRLCFVIIILGIAGK